MTVTGAASARAGAAELERGATATAPAAREEQRRDEPREPAHHRRRARYARRMMRPPPDRPARRAGALTPRLEHDRSAATVVRRSSQNSSGSPRWAADALGEGADLDGLRALGAVHVERQADHQTPGS